MSKIGGKIFGSKPNGTGGGGTPITAEWPIIKTAVDVNPALPYKRYLVDSSGGLVTITLPDVVADNTDSFYILMESNSNHIKIVTVGGQLIDGQAQVGIRGEKQAILIKANGVDGYDLVLDTRVYDRIVTVTTDLDLSGGFESGGLYDCQPADGSTITITIDNFTINHAGDFTSFVKTTGENSTVRIITEDLITLDEFINLNDTGFTITTTESGYSIKQDSRPNLSNVSINFLPTDTISVIEPTYSILETSSQTEEIVTSSVISSADSLNPNSLGFWINDNKALIGNLSERNIIAYGQFKLTSAFNRNVRIKFKYYEYDYETDILNPVHLSETSYSGLIDNPSAYEEFIVTGTLPDNIWAETSTVGKTLVIELLAYKDVAAGDNPTIDIRTGGTAPSKTTIDVPVASVNHNTLGGVVSANIGTPDGHINNKFPLVFPNLTTTERDAITSSIVSMKIYNITEQRYEKYDGVDWVEDGGGGGGGFLTGSIVSVSKSSQTISTGTFTKIQLDTVEEDNLSEFDETTNHRFTATTAGTYDISTSITVLNVASNKFFNFYLYKNGVDYPLLFSTDVVSDTPVSPTITPGTSGLMNLVAGDYLELFVFHAFGVDGSIQNAHLSIKRIK